MLKPFTEEGQFECGLADVVRGNVCALTPVTSKDGIGLGIVVANSPGYYPVPLFWCRADTYEEMARHADELNKELFDLDAKAATMIVASSMNKKSVR